MLRLQRAAFLGAEVISVLHHRRSEHTTQPDPGIHFFADWSTDDIPDISWVDWTIVDIIWRELLEFLWVIMEAVEEERRVIGFPGCIKETSSAKLASSFYQVEFL